MVKKGCGYTFKGDSLCTPAFAYFALSFVSLVILAVQNILDNDSFFCIGNYKCSTISKTVVFVLHTFYVLFWTFLLDLLCKTGYKELSWFIFLIPFILVFLFFGIMVYKDISTKTI